MSIILASTKVVGKPPYVAPPKIISSLGDHLRTKRICSDQLQLTVSEILHVCEDTITGWERGRNAPVIYHYQKIIAYLGYYPFDHETDSIAGKLRQWRYCLGLPITAAGKLLKADSRYIHDWERGVTMPPPKRVKQITMLWKQLPPALTKPMPPEIKSKLNETENPNACEAVIQ